MRNLKLLLILFTTFIILPAHAADTKDRASTGEAARPENAEPQKDQNTPQRAARPKREAVKLSPNIHPSAPRPDESGKMRRVAPPRGKAPLQDVPALMEPPSGGDAPKNR